MTEAETRDAAGGAPIQQKPARKRRALTWMLIVLGGLLLLFLTYRWAGTSHHRGTIQRVYEKESIFRVEYVDLEGNVQVAENRDILFPYVKLDTADLHAELSRHSHTQDIVDLEVWGFRIAWFSIFPNVVGVDFVKSSSDRRRARAEQVADAALKVLTDKGLLKGGEGVREDVVVAVDQALAVPDPRPLSGPAEPKTP